jgi:hypothetical protein
MPYLTQWSVFGLCSVSQGILTRIREPFLLSARVVDLSSRLLEQIKSPEIHIVCCKSIDMFEPSLAVQSETFRHPTPFNTTQA